MEPMQPMKPMQPMAPMKPMAPPDRLGAPADWGEASTAGGQNGVWYAYFAQPRRLVVDRDGQRTTYDTADHRISGVAQQQSDTASGRLAFSTGSGTVEVGSLEVV